MMTMTPFNALPRSRRFLIVLAVIVTLWTSGRYVVHRWPSTEKDMQQIPALLGEPQTHCVGRYLIDMPQAFGLHKDSEGALYIGLDADHDQLRLKPGRRGMSAEEFRAMVQASIAEWDKPKPFVMPGEPPTRLAKSIQFGDEALLFTRQTDRLVKAVDLRYLAFRDGTSVELIRTANGDEAKIARSTARLLDLAKRISRVQDPNRSGKGTCFDDMLIAGKYDEEKLDMYFMADERHRGLRLRVYFAGIQNEDKEDVFARRRSAFNLWGATLPTLLNRSYEFQGMKANEDAFSTPSEVDNGKTNYLFQFETRRGEGSIERPLIRVVLNVGVYEEGKQIGTDLSQGEVKALWEAIIKTLRPRPGAV